MEICNLTIENGCVIKPFMYHGYTMKQMYHFLLTDEDQKNIEILKSRLLKTSGVDLTTAALFRTLLRNEAANKEA